MDAIKIASMSRADLRRDPEPRKGRTFHAAVAAEGLIETTSGRRYTSPSPALKEYVGHDINGWGNWTVERTGKSLQEIRHQA